MQVSMLGWCNKVGFSKVVSRRREYMHNIALLPIVQLHIEMIYGMFIQCHKTPPVSMLSTKWLPTAIIIHTPKAIAGRECHVLSAKH